MLLTYMNSLSTGSRFTFVTKAARPCSTKWSPTQKKIDARRSKETFPGVIHHFGSLAYQPAPRRILTPAHSPAYPDTCLFPGEARPLARCASPGVGSSFVCPARFELWLATGNALVAGDSGSGEGRGASGQVW
ncbi:hypothetical protein Droror1_Dr00016250 [Drosera rotundifolia]